MTKAPERIWVWPDYNDHCIPFKQDWTHGFWDETEDPLGTEYVRADRIKAQAAEIERLVKERDDAVHLARMRKTFIEEARDERDTFEAKLENLIGGAETVLEAWDSGDEASFREAIEEMRADVEEAKGGKDE